MKASIRTRKKLRARNFFKQEGNENALPWGLENDWLIVHEELHCPNVDKDPIERNSLLETEIVDKDPIECNSLLETEIAILMGYR